MGLLSALQMSMTDDLYMKKKFYFDRAGINKWQNPLLLGSSLTATS